MRLMWALLLCFLLVDNNTENAGAGDNCGGGISTLDGLSCPTDPAANFEPANIIFFKPEHDRVDDILAMDGVANSNGSSTIITEYDFYAFLPLVVKAPPLIPPEDLENEQSIASQINEQRSLAGLSQLTLTAELTQSARKHSGDMAENGFTGHTGSDGSSPGQRISEAGYGASYWGEIIGWGFAGNSSWMVDWWMNSPVHKSLILSSIYEDFGVGYTRDATSDWGHYWTVNFGLRSSSNNLELDDQFHRCTYSITSPSGGSSITINSIEPCP